MECNSIESTNCISGNVIMHMLELSADIQNWNKVCDFVNKFMTLLKVDNNESMKLLLAIEEIFVNVASYAYPDNIGSIRITLKYDKISETITITFEDSGIPFDPTKKADPNLQLPPEKRKIGGLGIYLVSQIADSMEYEYLDTKNRFSITKKLINREMDKMEMNKTREGNNVIYEVVGRVDTHTAPDLQDEVDRTFEETEQNYDNKISLVLDFAGVDYLSSAGLRAILYIKKKIDTMDDSSLKIINVVPIVMEVFSMTGFSDFLDLNSDSLT